MNKDVEGMLEGYEKKIFDLTQLLEISKSLNSNLDYNDLIQSILYICMGQLKVFRAGLFVRRDIHSQDLCLHRSQVGFEIDDHEEPVIPEGHPVLNYLQEHPEPHSGDELISAIGKERAGVIGELNPLLVMPLKAKSVVNGVIILDEHIDDSELSTDQREYAASIAVLAGIAVHNAFLYEITTTDVMTGLRLRHFFLDTLASRIAQSRKKSNFMSLIMADIDNFKSLNDTFGHVMGDEAIVQVSQTIRDNIRQTDMAARYGGEEFIVLLTDTREDAAFAVAQRIRQAIADMKIAQGEETTSITISMGIATFQPDADITTQLFVDRADKALYKAKHSGKNRVEKYTQL